MAGTNSWSPISSLPRELYDLIVKFCIFKSEPVRNMLTLKSLRLVSWPFYHAAGRLLFRKVQYMREGNIERISRHALEGIISSEFAGAVHRLKVGAWTLCEGRAIVEYDLEFPEIISQCLNRFDQLRSITLSCGRVPMRGHLEPPVHPLPFQEHSMGEELLKALCSHHPKCLQFLKVSNFGRSGDIIPAESLKPVVENLHVISLNYNFQFPGSTTTDSGLFAALKYARNLRKLEVIGTGSDSKASFDHLHPDAPLHFLTLNMLTVTFEGICSIRRFKRTLDEISIFRLLFLTDGTWERFYKMLLDFPRLANGVLHHGHYLGDYAGEMASIGQPERDLDAADVFNKKMAGHF